MEYALLAEREEEGPPRDHRFPLHAISSREMSSPTYSYDVGHSCRQMMSVIPDIADCASCDR
jgi:hypothetical protein